MVRNLTSEWWRQRFAADDAIARWVGEPTLLAGPPDTILREREFLALARALVAQLPPRQAEICLLRLDGWTIPEIATELDLTRSSVRSHLQAARDGLRSRWPEELGKVP